MDKSKKKLSYDGEIITMVFFSILFITEAFKLYGVITEVPNAEYNLHLIFLILWSIGIVIHFMMMIVKHLINDVYEYIDEQVTEIESKIQSNGH